MVNAVMYAAHKNELLERYTDHSGIVQWSLRNVNRLLLAFVDRLRVFCVNYEMTINWCCRSQLLLADHLAKFVRQRNIGWSSDAPLIFVNSFSLVCNIDLGKRKVPQ